MTQVFTSATGVPVSGHPWPNPSVRSHHWSADDYRAPNMSHL